MSDATSTTPACPPVTSPDLTTFARVDALGLRVEAQQIWPDKAILFCSLVTVDDRCPRCGAGGRVHDQVLRRFTHLPVGPTADVAVGPGAPVPLRWVWGGCGGIR
jgi:hypothetical protein